MPPKGHFGGVRGTHSMKVRGGGETELERHRIAKLSKHRPGTWGITPGAIARDRSLGRATPLHVAALLSIYRDATTGEAVVREKRLASELGIGRRMLQLHINKLIKGGHLVVIPQRLATGGYTVNRYILLYRPLRSAKDDKPVPDEVNFATRRVT